MKKTDFILIAIIILIFIIGSFCLSAKDNNKDKDVSKELVSLVGDAGLSEISYTDYENAVNNGDTIMIIFERTGCSYCELFMPVAEAVASEKNIPIKYIDIANLSDDEFDKLTTSNEYFESTSDWGTPTTLILSGKEVVDSLSGYVENSELEEFVTDNIKLS